MTKSFIIHSQNRVSSSPVVQELSLRLFCNFVLYTRNAIMSVLPSGTSHSDWKSLVQSLNSVVAHQSWNKCDYLKHRQTVSVSEPQTLAVTSLWKTLLTLQYAAAVVKAWKTVRWCRVRVGAADNILRCRPTAPSTADGCKYVRYILYGVKQAVSIDIAHLPKSKLR